MATPSAEPVLERILADLESVITAVEGPDASYWNDLTGRRPTMLEDERESRPRNGLVLVQLASMDRVEDNDAGGNPNMIGWQATVALDAFVRVSDVDTTPIDRLILRMMHDVSKAVMADATRGGNAVTTDLQPPVFFQPNVGGFEGVRIMADVLYRTDETDLSVLR